MSENEEWQSKPSAPENQPESNTTNGGREGYRSYNRDGGSFGEMQPRYNADGSARPRRPRFNNNSERAYRSNGQQNERGFRPEGFGNRPGDGQQRQGYGQRPSYNNNRGGFGYDNAARPSYPRQHNGNYSRGFRPNSGYNDMEGGSYGPQRGEGYAPREGYGPQRGGYGQQRQGGGGYGQQRGRYGQPQRGGGSYGPQRGGYGQQRQGGYGQRPRQQRPGYDPNAKYSMKKRIEYKEYIEDPDAPIRLNKFLANAGVCSRREADQFIQTGVVRVNNEVVTELGTKVQRTDTVHFHDQLVSLEKKVYVLLNKPKDYVTTSDDPQQRKTVMELVKNCCRERIYPVGRLDRNTMGVLLFTNDGDMASKLTHPKFLKKKIYHVFLDKNVTAADMKQITDGITLEDGEVHADAISYASDTDKKQVGIEIHSGKNRIVRRIFESLGYRVHKLDRVMFAGLTKKGLKRGDWRFLTEQEVAMLHMGSFE